MKMDLCDLSPSYVRSIAPYQPGKPISELAREMGLQEANIVKLASNENPRGIGPRTRAAIEAALGEIARYPDGNGFELKQALATMGDPGQAAEIGSRLAADDRQYQGRSAATTATGLARQGNFAAAMSALAPLDGNDDIDVAWWRTAGYLAIARQERLPEDKRREALDAARASAEKVPDWRKIESLQSVAEEYRRMGTTAEARACLTTAQEGLASLPTTMAIRSPLISNLARSWAKAGDKERARTLLSGAAAHVDDAMLTERPAIWANIAASYAAVGDEALAWQTYDRALTAAAVLENARPRALGVVSVCRLIGRAGLTPPAAMQSRFEGLYKCLKDPW
jgi:hypothetical protein